MNIDINIKADPRLFIESLKNAAKSVESMSDGSSEALSGLSEKQKQRLRHYFEKKYTGIWIS